MNFKKQALQLEKFLDDEFKNHIPVSILPDKSLQYKQFNVKQNARENWELKDEHGNLIHEFKLKTAATIAAKYYDKTWYNKVNDLKMLDINYWNSSSDSIIFKKRFEQATSEEKRYIYLTRFELSKNRADKYKKQIISQFRLSI